jgi:hypothetical protein
VDLAAVAGRTEYVGSAEHKSYPSPAGPPRLRADASRCEPSLHGNFEELTVWLRAAIIAGDVGAPWEGDFPRYAWIRRDGVLFEGRLVNSEAGWYKGYQLLESQVPDGFGDA